MEKIKLDWAAVRRLHSEDVSLTVVYLKVKARSAPYAIKPKVDNELQTLLRVVYWNESARVSGPLL